MILLDTNVVSAVMMPIPNQAVADWLDRNETGDLFLSAVSVAEILYGLRILPRGKRRQTLEDRFDDFVCRGFERRILAFDHKAGRFYGELMGRRREIGRPMSSFDGQIAAIARSHNLAVATGNVRDFEECGLRILNPFDLGGAPPPTIESI